MEGSGYGGNQSLTLTGYTCAWFAPSSVVGSEYVLYHETQPSLPAYTQWDLKAPPFIPQQYVDAAAATSKKKLKSPVLTGVGTSPWLMHGTGPKTLRPINRLPAGVREPRGRHLKHSHLTRVLGSPDDCCDLPRLLTKLGFLSTWDLVLL